MIQNFEFNISWVDGGAVIGTAKLDGNSYTWRGGHWLPDVPPPSVQTDPTYPRYYLTTYPQDNSAPRMETAKGWVINLENPTWECDQERTYWGYEVPQKTAEKFIAQPRHENGIYTNSPRMRYSEWVRQRREGLTGRQERIYIAGPYRADDIYKIHENCMVADGVARECRKLGHIPFCPHTMTYGWENDFSVANILELDNDYIRSWATALYYIGPSEGANSELKLAESLNLNIYRSLSELPVAK